MTQAYARADAVAPLPIVMCFHGWMGSTSDCASSMAAARARGFATLSLTGVGGGPPWAFGIGNWASWNGFRRRTRHLLGRVRVSVLSKSDRVSKSRGCASLSFESPRVSLLSFVR